MYVSDEWREDKSRNPVYGWQRLYIIESKPEEYRKPKRIEKAEPDAPIAPVEIQTVEITGEIVNVRTQPKSSSAKIATVSKGQRLILVAVAPNGWFQAELLDGTIGYITSNPKFAKIA